MSDHVPIKLSLRQAASASSRGPRRMRADHLTSLHLQELIQADWLNTSWLMAGQPAHDILRRCTRRASKIVRNWEINRAKDHRLLKAQHEQQLAALRFRLQDSLHDHAIQLEIRSLEQLINDDDLHAAHIAQERLHAQWLQDGEKCSKRFFLDLKSRSAANIILAIRDVEGVLLTDPMAIRDTITSFFWEVLAAISSTSFTDVARAQAWVLQHMTDRISEFAKSFLQEPISGREILVALRAMPKGRTP